MNDSNILDKLQEAFQEFFEGSDVIITENSAMEDIEDWDSVTHIQLIFEIETAFDIQFDAEIIPELTSIRKIVDTIVQLSC